MAYWSAAPVGADGVAEVVAVVDEVAGLAELLDVSEFQVY